MFARKRTSHARAASESFGWKVSKTLSCVSSVSRSSRCPAVLALPEEGLAARDALDVLRARAAGGEDREILVREVVADRPDGPHLVEERRGQREVRGRAAELVISGVTEKFHVNSILRKLHVANRAEAVARYYALQDSRR